MTASDANRVASFPITVLSVRDGKIETWVGKSDEFPGETMAFGSRSPAHVVFLVLDSLDR